MVDKLITQITISNLTKSQLIALEDMLATWVQLGNVGSSRWTSFYADGDGNFRPKIEIDGRKPEFTKLIPREVFWENEEYRIDFDTIAWSIDKE